jgi:opacity protein-like surface antigen
MKTLMMLIVVLFVFTATTASAVPVNIYHNRVAQLKEEQVELLKRQPGIYYLKKPPETLYDHYIIVQLPDEFGGGFIIARPEDMAAALKKVGGLEGAEIDKLAKAAPRPPMWFTEVYFGGGIPQDGDVDGEASPFGVTIEDSANNVDYDNTFVVGGRAGYWSPHLRWAGFAVDVSYFQLDADSIETRVFPVSGLAMFRYPGATLQPYIGIGPALFITDVEVDIELSGQAETFSESRVDIGLDSRAGLAWKVYKHIAVFSEYRFTYYQAEYKESVRSGGTKTHVEIETDNKVHHILLGVSYRF